MPTRQTFDSKNYRYVSPQNGHELIFSLAQKIQKQIENGSLQKPEIIIGIERGSLPFMKTLAEWLQVEETETIRIVHYKDVGIRLPHPTILKSHLPRLDKKRVLLFDNIVETGKTMEMAINFLAMCGAEKVESAVLFQKPTSIVTPTFCVEKLSAWIIFYFDIVETIKLLSTQWMAGNESMANIYNQLLMIGLPHTEVETAMDQLFNFQPK